MERYCGTDWESLTLAERLRHSLDPNKIKLQVDGLKEGLTKAGKKADDSITVSKSDEISMLGSKIFHEGELELQYRSETLAFAKKVGEPKISPNIPLEIVDFITNRHAVHVASMEDPKGGAVWLTPIWADPADVESFPKETDEGERTLPPMLSVRAKIQERDRPEMLTEQVRMTNPLCKPWDHCNISTAAANLVTYFQSSAFKPLLQVIDHQHIRVLKVPPKDDPLWIGASRVGSQISLNLLEFETRKRYRTNGVISEPISEGRGFTIEVRECFSTCPKYIQRRTIYALHDHKGVSKCPAQFSSTTSQSVELPDHLIHLITHVDTMLIATVHPTRGADSSHRGGRPGFVRVVDKNKIVWPDYEGKGMYQTLGNALIHPSAGLTFVDFEGAHEGHVLQVTGKLEIRFVGDGQGPDGAGRICILSVERWIFRDCMLPYRFQFLQYSSFDPVLADSMCVPQLVGQHVVSAASAEPALKQKGEAPIVDTTITAIREESTDVKTFRLSLGERRLSYLPGQYAAFMLFHRGLPIWRAWTVSSATIARADELWKVPREVQMTDHIEISVKRNPIGLGSTWLHDHARVGDVVTLLGIEGVFTIDASEKILSHPQLKLSHNAVLDTSVPARQWWRVLILSAGIGITPFISHIRGLSNALTAGIAKEDTLPDILMIHSEMHAVHIPFQDDLRRISHQGNRPFLRLAIVLSHENPKTCEGMDIAKSIHEAAPVHYGFLNEQFIKETVPDIANRVVYMCGPDSFMSAMTQILREKCGVDERFILAESFDF